MRKKRIILLLALLPALLLTAPLAAQKDVESAPLIAMLGSLPNTRAVRESIIGWADLRVADEAAGLPPMTTRAAYELARRLAEVEIMMLSTRTPLLEVLESRGLSLGDPALVTDWATGRELLALALEGELLFDEGGLRSGGAMRLWVDMIYRRDLVWLY